MTALQASSKKRAIEMAATHIAAEIPNLEVGEVYRGLIEREKLGTTAIGQGVAIPHCRLSNCDQIIGALFVMNEPVDFSAYDDQAVQIMFVLLVPESETSEHLATLALLAERFQQEKYRTSLINSDNNLALYQAAIEPNANDSQQIGQTQ